MTVHNNNQVSEQTQSWTGRAQGLSAGYRWLLNDVWTVGAGFGVLHSNDFVVKNAPWDKTMTSSAELKLGYRF